MPLPEEQEQTKPQAEKPEPGMPLTQENIAPRLSPGGLVSPRGGTPVYVSESFLQNPEAQRVFQSRGVRVQTLPQPGPSGERWAVVHPQYGYWENPQRVARYYNLIRTAPPGWTPPPWLDTQAVSEAYHYLRYKNQNKDWTEWKSLPDDDPATPALRSMPAPPVEILWPTEKQYATWSEEQINQQKPFKWEDMPRWQQWILSVAVPQTSIEGRPEWSRMLASLGVGAMAGLGGAYIGRLAGPWGSLVGALALGGGAAYQAYTGTTVPVLNDILQAFDALAIFAKRGLGTIRQSGVTLENLQDAWNAAEANYAVSTNDAINTFARILDFLDFNSQYFEVNPENLAKKNQVWMIHEGIVKPVTISDPRDAEALNWLRDEIRRKRLNEGATPDEIRAFVDEFKARYGTTGIINDLVYETIIDPSSLIPFLSGKIGKTVSSAVGNERLAAAFEASTGSPVIDILPPGLQQLAEGITGVRGSSGIVGAIELYKGMVRQGFYPPKSMDMPNDMRAKFEELTAKGIRPDEIGVDGATLRWVENGQEKTFVASRPAEFKIPSIEELPAIEKNLAGIDERYGFRELRPVKEMGWLQRLTKLTPASQAHLLLNVLHSNLATMIDMAQGDVNLTVRLLKQAAGIDPVEAGDIGEAMLKSPATRAVSEALRYAITNNDLLDNLTAQWVASENRRTLLLKISKALNEEPGKVIEQLKTDADTLIARVNDIAPHLGTKEFLSDMLEIYTGDDAIPWHPGEFQARLAVKIADGTEGFLRQQFGLKPDSWVFRLNRTLKGVQSLVLLGFNPAYFFNNAINNVVTRAAEGVFGYMPPRQIQGFLDRFGIRPPRLDQGIGASGEGLAYGGKGIVGKAMRAGDALDESYRVVRSINEKIGIFSRLSANFERLESRLATTIGIKRFMDKAWRRGSGFRRLHPVVEATLERIAPGMKDVLYGAVESGLNIGEIENAIFGEYVAPQIEAIADRVGRSMFPDTPNIAKAMLSEAGILDDLHKELAGVKTPGDVDIVFSNVEEKLQSYVERQVANDLIARAEAVNAITKAERIPAVLSMYGDLEIMIAQHWIDGRRRFEDLYSRRKGMTPEQWRNEIKAEFDFQDREWRRVYELETQTYAGIIKALGINSELGRRFISLLEQVHDTWAEFHKEAAAKRQVFFDDFGRREGEAYDTYAKRRDLAWNRLQDELDDLYQKHYEVERTAQMAMDDLFAQSYADATGWDIEAAKKWRQAIRDIRYEMFQLQREHRRKTRNMSIEERDAAYSDFNPVYNQMIAAMKQLEQDGAYELARRPAPARKIEIPPAREIEQTPETPPEPEFSSSTGTLMELAKQAGIVDRQGRPVARYALNVINKWLRENGKPEIRTLADANLEDVQAAFDAHVKRHQAERVREIIKTKIAAEDIFEIADQQRREAEIRAAGMMTRRMVEEKLRELSNLSEMEVAAVMTLLDLHADQFARQQGLLPNEATRDAWYATRIAEIGEGGIIDKTDLFQSERGSIKFLEDGRAVIRAFSAADISTLVHEIGHIFRRELDDVDLEAAAKLGNLRNAAEFKDLEAKFWSKTATKEEASRYRNAEEMFARGWERYLAEGDAPTPALRNLFKRFTQWMLNIYKELRKVAGKVLGFDKTELGVDIRAEINGISLRDIFDRLLVEEPFRVDYNSLLRERIQRIRETGRNWRLDEVALRKRAEKELVKDILSQYKDAEEARTRANQHDEIYMPDGRSIDSSIVYDALKAAENPEISPWRLKNIPEARGVRTTARGITNPNNLYEFEFKVVDLYDLQPSNRWVGDRLELNLDYPQELQPRERTEAQSVIQVDTIARTLVPDELLYDARALDRGAPIVGKDNAVESGNGRVLALLRAFDKYPDKFQEYRQALIEAAPELGIDPAQFENMKAPVLVRERLSDTNRVAFVQDANRPVAMRMNVFEVAVNDANLISDESLANLDVGENETIDAAVQSQRNAWFASRFLEKLSQNERAELSANGMLNQQGVQRIVNAIFAKVYTGESGERLLKAFSMSMSNNVKAAEGAIMASLPQIARMEAMISRGTRSKDLSIVNDISVAVDKLASLRSSNVSVSDYLNQISFFGEELTQTQKALLQFISEQRSPKRIREFLREYAALVEKQPDPEQQSLFALEPVTKEDLIREAIRQTEPEAERFFTTGAEPAKTTETETALSPDKLAQPEPRRPGIREAIARGMERPGETARQAIITQAKFDYDAGRPVPISQAGEISLTHDSMLPAPDAVPSFYQIVNSFRFEAKTFANDYVDWVLSGERGPRPQAANPVVEKNVIAKFANSLDAMRKAAAEMTSAKRIGGEPIPAHGVCVAKVYRFNHGDNSIVAAVYKDGKLVALVPQGFNPESFEVRGGTATLLGLAPDNPDMYVYELDGRIKQVNKNNPGVEDNTSLFQSKRQSARSNWYLRKKIDEMTPEEMRQAIETLRSQATTDELTGLRNLRAFASDEPMAIVIAMDLAGLKKVNDTYGHAAGDNLLKTAAGYMREVSENAYRLHGDEFAIYARTAEEAEQIVTRLKDRIGKLTIVVEKNGNPVEVSGFDIHYGIGKDYESADADLYRRRYGREKPAEELSVPDDRLKINFTETNPENPLGQVPLNGTPEPQPVGFALHELSSTQIAPMLRRMREEFKRAMEENRKFRFGNIDPDLKKEIRKWLETAVRSDLASTKMAALHYGEQMRDAALLNYNRRYGADNLLELVFPYQFWYTRTIMNWARRMIDKPSWYAMYYRLKRAQDEMERKGMPSRLKGKVRLPMPWMPEWTGKGLWIDPLKQFFPFAQFGQPFEQFALDKNQIERRAEQILDDMVQAERITYSEAQDAKTNRNNAAWQQAVKQAEGELDKSANPLNLVSMLMSPALWWTIPANLASGRPEKISPMPITRTGQTVRELGRGTIAEPVTNIIGGIMAGPEEYVRRKASLSEFGEWGDYYIDRMLANMAADGTVSADDARIAMIQRSGPVFEMAKQRVAYEATLRTPGVLGIQAIKEGAKPGEVLAAILASIFPGGLFPEGELKQRGLKVEYDNAWRKLKAGDDKALQDFFDKHPEYEARLALWDDPDTRLRQFLIDKVWERYFSIDKPNRRKVVKALGPEFEDFLNRETRDEEGIDIQLLAMWAQAMGAMLPKTDALEGMPSPPTIEYYQPQLSQAIASYQEERDRLFPNYYALQETYYSLPAGPQRKAFLRQFPSLRQYWRWKDQYKREHPEIIPYFDELKQESSVDETINDLDTAMLNELLLYSIKGKMSEGGYAEMRRLYNLYGRPAGLDYDEYVNIITRTIFR